MLVQCLREPLDESLLDTLPGNTQASVGECDPPELDDSGSLPPPGSTQASVFGEADPPQLHDTRLLSPPGNVQGSIEEVAAKNPTG